MGLLDDNGRFYEIEHISYPGGPNLSSTTIAELEIYVPQGGDRGGFDLGVVLRCGPVEIDDGGVSFTFGVQRAELQVLLTNCVIPTGSVRFADDQLPAVARHSVNREFEAQREQENISDIGGSASIALNGPQAQLSANASESSRTQYTNRESETDEREFRRVTAGPGNIWSIQELNDDYLSGKYLGDEVLCEITPQREPFEIEVKLKSRPRYFKVDDVTFENDETRRNTWFHDLSNCKKSLIKRAISKLHFVEEKSSREYIIRSEKLRTSKD